jgi:hypothetical protein
MMAMTTRSSISVNARLRECELNVVMKSPEARDRTE